MVPKPPPQYSPLDSIPFELTDLEQARHALDELPAGVEMLTQNGEVYWERRRRKPGPADNVLTSAARQWLAELPPALQPRRLAEKVPRLVNAISASWPDKARCADELDALIADRRGGRRGFALEIEAELRLLRKHLESLRQRGSAAG